MESLLLLHGLTHSSLPGDWSHRHRPGSSRCDRHPRVDRGARGAAAPSRRPPANHAIGTSTSCPTHTPSPRASIPTGCRSDRHDRESGDDRPWASGAPRGEAVRCGSTAHREAGACSCPDIPHAPFHGSVRCSKGVRILRIAASSVPARFC